MAPESQNETDATDNNSTGVSASDASRGSEERTSSGASGVSLPMIGMDVNKHLPPAGEPYAHEDFRVGTDRCPVNNCEGQLNRVKVMAEDPNSGAPSHIKTLEVSCLECQRIVFKNDSVEYDRGE